MTTPSPPPAKPFRVAIIGAGIAGLTAAISLHHFFSDPGTIQVTIYEQATQLREIGASIGLNPSGLRILDKLGVDYEPVAFRQLSGRPMIYRHWETNTEIGNDVVKGEVEDRHRMARFHRAHLQGALLQALPEGVELRLGMRVERVDVGEGGGNTGVAPVTALFEDGHVCEADLLIGADGIHSKVRKAFVPEHQLKWTGQVAFRSAFDASLVEGIEGLPEEAVFWVGHERTFFASRLGKNQYTVVGSYNCDPDDPNELFHDAKWNGPGDLEFLRSLYKGWNPTVESILNVVPYTKTYPNHAGTPLDSLVFQGRVALLGDAAHTHGGAFAAGGSLAIGDAYVLAWALAHLRPPQGGIPDKEQLERALGLYDAARRPLVTRVLDLVHGAAQKRRWTGPDGGSKETDEELRVRIDGRPDVSWLTQHDVEAEVRRVVASLEEGDADER